MILVLLTFWCNNIVTHGFESQNLYVRAFHVLSRFRVWGLECSSLGYPIFVSSGHMCIHHVLCWFHELRHARVGERPLVSSLKQFGLVLLWE